MVEFKLAAIGHSELDDFGGLKVQASLDPDDMRQYSRASWFAGLGVTGMPYGPDVDDGGECIIIDRLGPYNGVVVAARDRRGAKIYGQMEPGDTVLHCTGPDPKPQVLLKREKKIAAVLTEDSQGKTAGIIIEGAQDRATVTLFGWTIQVTREGGIVISSRNGLHGITITDDGGHLRGNWVMGGATPVPGMALMMGPLTGQPAGGPTVMLTPALGVTVGQ